MYETRQNKEKVSRRIGTENGTIQRNYMNIKSKSYKCDSALQCKSITSFNSLPFLTNKSRKYTIEGRDFHPEIYIVTRNGKNISKILSPLVAQVGNAVSVVLKNNKTWRRGEVVDNDNLLNEFHVVYDMPKRGIREEVVYNSNQNSYGLAAEIGGSSNVNYRSYARGVNKSHFEINLNDGDSQYSETHQEITEQTINNTILNAKDTKEKAGDALSMAAVEAARFKFLRNHIGKMKTNTLLRFGNKCVYLSVLLSNYKNIIRTYNKGYLPTQGWEKYGLTATMILEIQDHLDFFASFDESKKGKYFDAVNEKFHYS